MLSTFTAWGLPIVEVMIDIIGKESLDKREKYTHVLDLNKTPASKIRL